MLRVVGDVHAKVEGYIFLVCGANNSVQIGDMGFKKTYLELLQYKNNALLDFNFDDHKFFCGNHDSQDDLDILGSFYLGRYGNANVGNTDFFYVSGALSIDKHLRTEDKSWWRNEELNYQQAIDCFDLYVKTKPSIVLSHDCPQQALEGMISHHFDDKSLTRNLLTNMFDAHQPRLWVFGHHHQCREWTLKNCKFICLNELEFIDI